MPETTARTVRLNLVVPGPYFPPRGESRVLVKHIEQMQAEWIERAHVVQCSPWRFLERKDDAFMLMYVDEDGGYIFSTRAHDCSLMVYECEVV